MERVSVLAIAYHNMGVELQYLKRYEECISAYDVNIDLMNRKDINSRRGIWVRVMGWLII